MINREDMLELTRRMTPSRTSFTRVAGGYMEPDGEIDESFNVNFLNLSAADIIAPYSAFIFANVFTSVLC